MAKDIVIKGASENNLKNLDVTIPRDKFIVLTGLSGSGKSSLAFDTIYAEGQRKYMESLSSYARQFLGQMEKPKVEYIEGLSPAISIDQKSTNQNPRSTVGTVTEIYDYLRLLYARIGIPHCPICGREITSQSVDQIVETLMLEPAGSRLTVMAPVVRARKGQHEKVLDRIRREGFTRARVDGEIKILDEDEIKLEKTYKHTIEIVVDRIKVRDGVQSRLSEACELAIANGEGLVLVEIIDPDGVQTERTFSTSLACPEHGVSIDELEPRMFSFNNPLGACPECKGLGFIQSVDPDLLIPDQDLSIMGMALSNAFSTMEFTSYYWQVIRALAEKYNADLTLPYKKMPKRFKEVLLYGTGDEKLVYDYTNRAGMVQHRSHTYEGIVVNLERRYQETNSEWIRSKIEQFMNVTPCPSCEGRRLRPELLAVTVGGKNIMELCDLSVVEAIAFLDETQKNLSETDQKISAEIIKEIRGRLEFLANVGLDYLTLSRAAATLSGGESQRIRLATQIGSGLVGVSYILDEPSIGLHQKDNAKLLKSLRELTDIGNTLIVVEHDEETMYAADQIIDIGPGAGVNGGRLVAQGTVDDIKACEASITGQYLSGRKKIEIPPVRREGSGKFLTVKGAEQNNLKKIDVKFPLGKFICVTGVSGSGKSSLVNEILYKAVAAEMYKAKDRPGKHKGVTGIQNIDKIIDIDQKPIGRTPRSNPATYTGVFTHIRDLFAQLPEAKIRGYGKGRFSFNVKGGRCEACKGDGIKKIEMLFLPDVYVPCEVCKGKRYNRETLEVKYKGKSIFDVLDMNVSEALEFFKNHPTIRRQLQTLEDVGLGYIKLGQPSTELSGGELASELSKRSTGKTLYILDEPTTGLHFADVARLLEMLNVLVDAGNTVVVIEHNLDVIKCADHIIDLGPDGGFRGGTIVAEGTPEEVAKVKGSYTGQYLSKLL